MATKENMTSQRGMLKSIQSRVNTLASILYMGAVGFLLLLQKSMLTYCFSMKESGSLWRFMNQDEPYIALSNAKKSLDIEKVLIKGCSSSRWITCPHCQLCWHSLHLFFILQPPNQEFWYLWSSLTFDFPRPFPDHQQSHPTDQPAKETGLSHPRHSDWRLHHSPPALRFTLNTSAWLESEKERDWSALL